MDSIQKVTSFIYHSFMNYLRPYINIDRYHSIVTLGSFIGQFVAILREEVSNFQKIQRLLIRNNIELRPISFPLNSTQ